MTVSVVIPTYNRELLLRRALESVLAQTHRDFECLITDNGSVDHTVAIAHEYAAADQRVRVLVNPDNVGPVRNWLRGTTAAQGDLVKLLFSDDWMDPGCLDAAVRAFSYHSGLGFVYFGSSYDSETRYSTPRREGLETASSFIWRSLLADPDIPVSPTAAVFRRSDVIDALTGVLGRGFKFDYLGTGAGYDQAIYLQAASNHRHVYYVDSPRVYYGSHDDSITVIHHRERPGYLMWGYLQAQLSFLERYRAGLVTLALMRTAVRWRLVKLFIRYRLAAHALDARKARAR